MTNDRKPQKANGNEHRTASEKKRATSRHCAAFASVHMTQAIKQSQPKR